MLRRKLLLMYNAPPPLALADFKTSSALPSWISFARAGNAMQYDSTGNLTYAGNNQVLNSATLSTQSVASVVSNYVLSFKGTGSVALSGTSTGTLNGTGANNRVNLAFTPTAGTLTLTVTGSVTNARLSQVTYETAMRATDDVDTTSAAYYGPRFDYAPSTLLPKGLLIEESRTNYVIQSEDITQAVWSKSSVTASSAALGLYGGVALHTLTQSLAGAASVYNSTGLSVAAGAVSVSRIAMLAGTLSVGWVGLWGVSTGFPCTAATFKIISGPGAVVQWAGSLGYVTGLSTTIPTVVEITRTSTNAEGITYYIYTNNGSGGGVGDTLKFGILQVEVGAFGTSYIPTTNAAVTRASDDAEIIGAALAAMQAANFSVVMEMTPVTNQSPVPLGPIWLGGPGMVLLYTDGIRDAADFDPLATPNSVLPGNGSIRLPSLSRLGVTSSSARRVVAINNGAIGSGGQYMTPRTGVRFGSYLNGSQPGSLWLSKFAVYNVTLPDYLLQAKLLLGAPL